MQSAPSRPATYFQAPPQPSPHEEAYHADAPRRTSSLARYYSPNARRQPSDRLDSYGLFLEFQPLVQRLIRQYGDEPELREDLVGEIYCRFRAVLEAYDPDRGIPLRPYLVHQLAYSVYSFVRRQWRRHRREITLEIDSISLVNSRSADESGHWDDAIMLRRVQAGLPCAISKLSLRQQQVLIWRYYEGLTFEEIAARLDVRLATARSTLRHALKNMRRRLMEEELHYD